MCKNNLAPVVWALAWFLGCATLAEGKSYKFRFNDERVVFVKRSGRAGLKIVEVTARAGSVDRAIDKAMVDAVAGVTFDGAKGQGEMEDVPAILTDPEREYGIHQSFFDSFFRKGGFLHYVHRVSDRYPSDENNALQGGKRRVRLVLIVDWDRLARLYMSKDIKTIISDLSY